MGRRSAADHNRLERVELEVFGTGSTLTVAPDPAPDDRSVGHELIPLETTAAVTLGDRVRHGGELMREGIEHARDFQARPGHRPGAAPVLAATTSGRAGGDTDIVRPVLVSPMFAGEFAATGRLFDEPIPNLSISHRDSDAERRFLIWDAELDTAGNMRQVTLHLLASPSMVVTVLELVPCRRQRLQRRRFVADGVAVVEEIAHRLERAARNRRQP